jgi:hypothetical protein
MVLLEHYYPFLRLFDLIVYGLVPLHQVLLTLRSNDPRPIFIL